MRTKNRLGGYQMETVTTMLEKVKDQVCDQICKWPEAYLSVYKDPDEASEKMLIEQCTYCPLQKI